MIKDMMIRWEVDYSSVKFRDNKLDTKWKRSRFEIDSKSTEYMNFSGGVLESIYLLAGKSIKMRKKYEGNSSVVVIKTIQRQI
jgi:hypothetical protein